jgi:hypothetical protein
MIAHIVVLTPFEKQKRAKARPLKKADLYRTGVKVPFPHPVI